MRKFVDLDVSVFDPAFTLNPYPYLESLYQDDNVVGFTSLGMNFIFKFDDIREVMFSKSFGRPAPDDEAIMREAEYAKKYPNRAEYFQRIYTFGDIDLKLKSLIVRLIGEISENVTDDLLEPVCKPLAGPGRLDNYLDRIKYLPMQLYLDTCGLNYTQEELHQLHEAGSNFLKTMEVQQEESAVALNESAIITLTGYVDREIENLKPEGLLYQYMEEGRADGIEEQKLRVNLGVAIIMSLSNTFGVSSAFVLRTLIHHPLALQALKADPSLLALDSTVTELLRLDNHVKSLSRCAYEDYDLRGYHFKKGELAMLFFPGLNRDPSAWTTPDSPDFSREFTSHNNLIFGGSVYMCIGKKITFAAMKSILKGFVNYLPENARIVEEELEVDASWLAERVINKMPIELG